jgi:hypothetical protein
MAFSFIWNPVRLFQMGDYFFLIFLVTIVVTRFGLVTQKIYSPTIKGFKLHHYMYGVVLLILAFFTKNIFLYAIGFALFLDEFSLVLFVHKKWKWKDYYEKWSFIDLLIIILVVFMSRDILTSVLFKFSI